MTESLLACVRNASASGIWSQGVRLARASGAVVFERHDSDQIVARVRAAGHPVAPTVTLYLETAEWTCDCLSAVDPCVHVVAAVIAEAQLAQEGPSSEGAPDRAPILPALSRRRLGYRLHREPGGLALTRVLAMSGGEETQLRQSLAAPAARALVDELLPREQDLRLDRLMGDRVAHYRLGPMQGAVLSLLEGATDIQLDGSPISVRSQPVSPLASVVDTAALVELRIVANPEMTEVVAPGLARCGAELRPLGQPEIAGYRWERLPVVKRFSVEQLGELTSRILPELQRDLVVDISSSRLPNTTRTLKPRVTFQLERDGESLVVVAQLVYGVPPTARIERGEMIQLGSLAPRRDRAAEVNLELDLRDSLDLLLDRPLRLEGLDTARFMARLSSWQQRQNVTSAIEDVAAVALRAKVEVGDGNPRIEFSSGGGGGEAVAAEVVLAAYTEGLDRVPLGNGGWGELPKQWLEHHAELLRDVLCARESNQKKSDSAAKVLMGQLCARAELGRPPSLEPYMALLEEVRSEPMLTSDLACELRPYQLTGVAFIQALERAGVGGILADDMGLGKTVQVLASLRQGRTLVVAPVSVLFNWAAEIERFRPALRVLLYHGPDRALDLEADVVLTSYAVLRLEQQVLEAVEWHVVVLDEAQAIKNPESQAAQAAFALRADLRMVLSGTPIENRLDELWSAMCFANPGLLGSRASFRDRFSRPIEEGDPRALDQLRRIIAPFLLRRLKRDVLPELPPRIDDVLWVELDDEDRNAYASLLGSVRDDVLRDIETPRGTMAVLEALLRLRQAACHRGLVPGLQASDSSKLQRLLEVLEPAVAAGQRALVFSQWTSLLDLLEPKLRSLGIAYLRLDGKTRDRGEVVAAFQDPAGPPLLIASLKVGGTGLNLTAADHVFLLDPWWNPAVEAQAADRAHRIGRTSTVFVHRLVAKDTVDERILSLQQQKRALGAVIEGGEPTQTLSREELLSLIG